MVVICTLAQGGMGVRGTNEEVGSLQNGKYLGMLGLISQLIHF